MNNNTKQCEHMNNNTKLCEHMNKIIFFYFFFLHKSYSAQPKVVVYCSYEVKLFGFDFDSTNCRHNFIFGSAKIAIWLFSITNNNAIRDV